MAVFFSRNEDGWSDVVETPAGWINLQAASDDLLLSALASPVPTRRWRARIVYMRGSRGHSTVTRVIEGEAAGRTEAMAQIQRMYDDKRGFYIAELHEVVEPVSEGSCRATVTI